MKYLLLFIISFIIIYLMYYLVVVARKKGIEAFKSGKQVLFFKNAYNLNLSKLNYKSFANAIAITNAFIIAFTVTIIELINKSLALKLLVGFVILMPLILLSYYILGKIYKKKEGK